MQLYSIMSSKRSTVWKTLQNLNRAVIWHPIEDTKFVFLCGANIEPSLPSKRRQTLLDFSERNLPHTKFFLAESIFTILKSEGNRTNLLDVENELFNFADFVIIVLESESAFCELGAFAVHKELRKKLIVINDKEFMDTESFINLGPIKAISESGGENRVLYYKMEKEGKIYGDCIGEIFPKIYDLVNRPLKPRRERVKEYNPNDFFTKDSLRFVHDLVYFASPVSFLELSRIVKIIFANSKDNPLQKHLGLLCATCQIERTEDNFYISLCKKPFFEYYPTSEVYNLIAAFKNFYYRYDPKRMKCN